MESEPLEVYVYNVCDSSRNSSIFSIDGSDPVLLPTCDMAMKTEPLEVDNLYK